MPKQLLMGNEAFGLGAIAAGVNVVCGYPGTPSTEVLEAVAKNNPQQQIHVEWSTNEKAALELAAGASYCGARCLVTMKQVGLNVASDPLMSLCYIGVKGGVVLLVADDPGPISSQTEQDTRRFGMFSKVPVLDPASPQEGYEMMPLAFELSERYGTPVIVRSTTRVSHGGGIVDVVPGYQPHGYDGFQRDPKWVIFPRRAYQGHLQILDRLPKISDELGGNAINCVEQFGQASQDLPSIGIAAGGISYAYVREALERMDEFGLRPQGAVLRLLKIGSPFPFPDKLGLEFLQSCSAVVCFEELDPVIEDALIAIAGSCGVSIGISGKHDATVRGAGENSVESVAAELRSYLERLGYASGSTPSACAPQVSMKLPPRPPVLCAGCPHRSAFYAVKKSAQGTKAFFSGDIGCYTLGNAMPLDMVDNCLCMGADITMAQGMKIAEPDATSFAFIGDSTFFASGMTGIVNSVYNGNDVKLMVLDNSTTAMTGHQPHPGTGVRMSQRSTGAETQPLSIEAILTAVGVEPVLTVDAHDLSATTQAVKTVMQHQGTSAVIFKAPCAAIVRTGARAQIDQQACKRCKKCIKEMGCPALTVFDGEVRIDQDLCNGCTLCMQICPFDAIELHND